MSQFQLIAQIGFMLLLIGMMVACGQSDEASNPSLPNASNDKATVTDSKVALSKEQEAWALIEQGALLVDVRSQEEFDAGHLKNALLIPYDDILAGLEKEKVQTDRAIVLYCRSGGRAERARMALERAGFSQVFNAGGYEALNAVKPATPEAATTP